MILPHGLPSKQKIPLYQWGTRIIRVLFTVNGGYSRLHEHVTWVQVCHLKRCCIPRMPSRAVTVGTWVIGSDSWRGSAKIWYLLVEVLAERSVAPRSCRRGQNPELKWWSKLCIYSQSGWFGLTPALVKSAAACNNHYGVGQVPGRATSSLQYKQISKIQSRN